MLIDDAQETETKIPDYMALRNGRRREAWLWRWHQYGGSAHFRARSAPDLWNCSRDKGSCSDMEDARSFAKGILVGLVLVIPFWYIIFQIYRSI